MSNPPKCAICGRFIRLSELDRKDIYDHSGLSDTIFYHKSCINPPPMPNKRSTIEMTEEETRQASSLLPPGVDFDEGYIQNWTDEHMHLRDLAPLIEYLTSINVDPYA